MAKPQPVTLAPILAAVIRAPTIVATDATHSAIFSMSRSLCDQGDVHLAPETPHNEQGERPLASDASYGRTTASWRS